MVCVNPFYAPKNSKVNSLGKGAKVVQFLNAWVLANMNLIFVNILRRGMSRLNKFVAGSFLLALAVVLNLSTVTPALAQSLSEQEFKTMLQRALKDNPDLVMNVLREHSAEVLDIAQQGNEEKKKPYLLNKWKEEAKVSKPIKVENRPTKGDPNAPVLIAVFSDFSCPHCAKASRVIEEALVSYPTKVRFIFKHRLVKGYEHSRLAAEYFVAASMQDEYKAWALYKGLYDGREQLIEKGEKFIVPLAKSVGLDTSKLAQDAASAKVKKIIDEDMEEAKKFGFDGAPYVMVNNLVLEGAPSPTTLNLAIDEALKLKK